jgi:protease I
MGKRVLMIVGDFVEDYEAMVPYQVLEMTGHEVIAVCPGKKKGDYVATAIHDFEGEQTYSEKRGHRFQLSGTFDQVKESKFDALVLPGGRSPEYLRLNPRVIQIVKYFFHHHLPVAAICHGAQILVAANVLPGRSCCAYPALRPDIEAQGGIYVAESPGLDNVHVDHRLVTAPAWPAHPGWLREFLRLLGTEWSNME